MKRILEILTNYPIGAIATSVDNKPYVRPQHLHFIKDNKYYFTTANTKQAYKQLISNPFVEYMVTTDKFETVRMRGSIHFANDMETKEMILDNCPLVKKGYNTADNPIFEVFYFEHADITLSDFSGQPPVKISI